MKDIPGFEGLYAVTEDGKVWSYGRKGKYNKPRFKGVVDNGFGYLHTVLSSMDGTVRNVYVHRLVAEAYIPNPHNLPQVNHKNGVKSDNRVANLEWCTTAYNNQHAYDTGLKRNGERHSRAILTEKDVLYILSAYKPRVVTHRLLAQKFGVSLSAISLIISGYNWKHIKRQGLAPRLIVRNPASH